MNTLYDCEINCKVKIIKLNANSELKQRLISFGIMKGSEIEVLHHTATKSTVEVKIGKMRIALRDAEAKLIEVQNI